MPEKPSQFEPNQLLREKLQDEIHEGVMFWGYDEAGALVGVMGIQQLQDVTLIRHAYVRTSSQKQGIGGHLLSHLRELAGGPMLIGTWAAAVWAIHFYERHGFQMVDPQGLSRRAFNGFRNAHGNHDCH